MSYKVCSEKETAALAADFAKKLSSGDVIFLQGDLGMGKTVFARGLIRALLGKDDCDVPSPTFTLVQTYETQKGTLWHFDFYRIEDQEEIYELGWEEALGDGIIVAEWPERLGGLAPEHRIDVRFAPSSDADGRIITITPQGNWKGQWTDINL